MGSTVALRKAVSAEPLTAYGLHDGSRKLRRHHESVVGLDPNDGIDPSTRNGDDHGTKQEWMIAIG
jgi:hypothetical protein